MGWGMFGSALCRDCYPHPLEYQNEGVCEALLKSRWTPPHPRRRMPQELLYSQPEPLLERERGWKGE